MRNSLLLAALIPCASIAADPFLAFNEHRDSGVAPLVQKYFRASDYLGAPMLAAFPVLHGFVTWEHQVVDEASIARVRRILAEGCGANTADTVFYHWSTGPHTPPNEKADPVGSTATAVDLIRSTGCHHVASATP